MNRNDCVVRWGGQVRVSLPVSPQATSRRVASSSPVARTEEMIQRLKPAHDKAMDTSIDGTKREVSADPDPMEAQVHSINKPHLTIG